MLSVKKIEHAFSKKQCYVNYGILRLASVIYESGIDALVVQGLFHSPKETLDRLQHNGYRSNKYPLLISITSFFAVPWASEFCKLFNEIYPNQSIYIGGRWVVNNRVDWIYEKIPNIDLVVCGTSDNYIVDLITDKKLDFEFTNKGNKYYQANSKMPKSPLRYELLDERHRFHPSIEVSRGCGRGCSFCEESHIKLEPLQEPKLVVENLKYLQSFYNKEKFYTYFEASNFLPTRDWAIKLSEEYKKYNLDCLWRCEIRVDTICPETLEFLSKSGLKVIDVGLESASPTQLRRMNKTKKPEQYLQKAEKLLQKASKLGVLSKLNVLFYPGETNNTIQETFSWIKERVSLIKGVSVGSLILFGTPNEITSAMSEYKKHGASIANPCSDDPEGVARLNLSEEIDFGKAEEYSSLFRKTFMSSKDYYDLKSFCYFPRNYSYSNFQKDIRNSTA